MVIIIIIFLEIQKHLTSHFLMVNERIMHVFIYILINPIINDCFYLYFRTVAEILERKRSSRCNIAYSEPKKKHTGCLILQTDMH